MGLGMSAAGSQPTAHADSSSCCFPFKDSFSGSNPKCHALNKRQRYFRVHFRGDLMSSPEKPKL